MHYKYASALEKYKNAIQMQSLSLASSSSVKVLFTQSVSSLSLSLRESLMLGQQMQAELATIKAEQETQRQESEQLRQTLQDSIDQLQRNQQQHSVAIRNNKVSLTHRLARIPSTYCMILRNTYMLSLILSLQGKTVRVGHHNCIPNENYGKVNQVSVCMYMHVFDLHNICAV